LGQSTLAVAPGNFFHNHSGAAPAVHAPHGIYKEDQESPQRNELKAPLGQLIVTRRRLMAARADRSGTLAGSHPYLDTLLVRTEPVVMIDKPPKAWAAV